MGGGGFAGTPAPDPDPEIGVWPDAQGIADDLEAVYAANAFSVTVGGDVVAFGYKPANGEYPFLYTRDHAYVVWHYPQKLTADQRRQFASYFLERRTDGSEADPAGGNFPADLVCDHMASDGTATYRNAGNPYPANRLIVDGIHFVVMALWADWNLTGHTATFTANETAIADCLAAIPRSASGCVYSDPADPITDYGFHDGNEKKGDTAYGTALVAWSYKMLAEIAGESGSGTYTTLRSEAEAGLATLRKVSGWYAPDSEDNAALDDVWATALIVAEGLVTGADRTTSATTIRDAYLAGTITQNGLIRHLVDDQVWSGANYSGPGGYQNGGYWYTPLWDCYRAVNLVDADTAHAWVQECLDQVAAEIVTYGANLAPIEWRNGATVGNPKGYTSHAALIRRFV